MNDPHKPAQKTAPNWTEMDTSLFDLECAVDLMEAVQTAIQTNDLPNDVCANAMFGACLLLRRVYSDLKIEFDGGSTQQPDRGNF